MIRNYLDFKKEDACIDIGSRNRHISNEECIYSMIALAIF